MCCCCPPAIQALFCLWIQSGCSKGTVAGALTFFPPDPPLYKFERCDENGNALPEGGDEGADSDKQASTTKTNNSTNNDSPTSENMERSSNTNEEGHYRPNEGESREKMKSPARQLTDKAKELRQQAKLRNAQDAKDAENGVTYKFILDPRLTSPRFQGGAIEAVKIPTKTKSYVAAVIYRVPEEVRSEQTRTIVYSHGNATDVGAMFPLQAILAHSLQCNVISYDYSGYGESGGMPMESNTYTDVQGVYDYTVEKLCDGDESRVVLYGQSVGSGPCCYMAGRAQPGAIVLHSPFMSGMRVLTPSRLLACLDIYPNIDRIKKVTCPVMLIHGRLDEEVDISHAVTLHQAVPEHLRRAPWWVPDRGHNDITEGPGKLAEYIGRLRRLLRSLEQSSSSGEDGNRRKYRPTRADQSNDSDG